MARRIVVRRARIRDLNRLARLVDDYRRFYRQPPRQRAVRRFLTQQLSRKDSVILVGVVDGILSGFAEMYPLFSTTHLARIFIVNDLYVAPEARNLGIGACILRRAESYARDLDAAYLELSTEHCNPACRLFERLGWIPDQTSIYYNRTLRKGLVIA